VTAWCPACDNPLVGDLPCAHCARAAEQERLFEEAEADLLRRMRWHHTLQQQQQQRQQQQQQQQQQFSRVWPPRHPNWRSMDPYECLGLVRGGCSAVQVRQAFHAAALVFHPDKRHPEGALAFPRLKTAHDAILAELGLHR
jgi:hypothetical protein